MVSFSPQQVHDDNILHKSTPSSDINVDWATKAMLQEIQCRFGLFQGAEEHQHINLGPYAVARPVNLVLIYYFSPIIA